MNKKFIDTIIHVVKKFTVLDWLLCTAFVVVFIFLFVNRLPRQKQWVSIKMKVTNDEWWWTGNSPEIWYGADLAKGQFSYNSFGEKVAEIQSMENYDAGGPRRLIIANLKILATYNKKTHNYSYNYQTLQIGKPLDFTFNQDNLHGLVTYIGDTGMPYKNTNIELKLLGIYPWEADALRNGMESKDSDGNIISTISQVDTTDSLVSQIRDNNGSLYLLPVTHPVLKDVTLQLTVKTYFFNGVPYFIDGTAIKIGNRIWIEFEKTAIKNATISNVF